MGKSRVRTPPPRLTEQHPDYKLLTSIEASLYRHAGGQAAFERDIPALLRQAIDEVIDTPRSKRFLVKDLEKTEKTYLGTKVEILLRNHLALEKGKKLDLLIDGHEVDVKNTLGVAWTIPNEAVGEICILISANDETAKCSFGLIVVHKEILNAGRNRDQKTTIKRSELHNAIWMLFDKPYPENFWEGLPADHCQAILTPSGGTERVARLFELYQRRPIARTLVTALAQQADPTRRLRKNGGARDLLPSKGLVLLSGVAHAKLIRSLGLPATSRTEWITFIPRTPEEKNLLARHRIPY